MELGHTNKMVLLDLEELLLIEGGSWNKVLFAVGATLVVAGAVAVLAASAPIAIVGAGVGIAGRYAMAVGAGSVALSGVT